MRKNNSPLISLLKYFFVLNSIWLLACASTKNKNFANYIREDGVKQSFANTSIRGLRVTFDRNVDLSDENFDVLMISFENESKEWIRLNQWEVDFATKAIKQDVKILNGRELQAWAKATQMRSRAQTHNSNVLLASILGLSVIGETVSSDPAIQNTAKLTGAASLSLLAAKSLQESAQMASGNQTFPENHLLREEVLVPPGLTEKRWIVFQVRTPMKQLSLRGQDQQSEPVRLVFDLYQ